MGEINIKLIIFSILWNLFTPRLNGYPNLNITAMVCLHAQDSIHRWKWARLVTFLSLNYVQNVLSKVHLIYISKSRNILLCDSKQLTLFKHACKNVRVYGYTYGYVFVVAHDCGGAILDLQKYQLIGLLHLIMITWITILCGLYAKTVDINNSTIFSSSYT